MINEKYFLVGMPGSGKSTIGKLFASKLNLPFVDLDESIVKKEGTSISNIFSSRGEEYFRALEREQLIKTIQLEGGLVVATGGGAPCFYDNIDLMNQSGVTIFIHASIDALINKLSKKGIQKRPLLKNLSDEGLYLELLNKFEDRKKFYQQSKITIEQNFFELHQVVNEVILAIKTLEK